MRLQVKEKEVTKLVWCNMQHINTYVKNKNHPGVWNWIAAILIPPEILPTSGQPLAGINISPPSQRGKDAKVHPAVQNGICNNWLKMLARNEAC